MTACMTLNTRAEYAGQQQRSADQSRGGPRSTFNYHASDHAVYDTCGTL